MRGGNSRNLPSNGRDYMRGVGGGGGNAGRDVPPPLSMSRNGGSRMDSMFSRRSPPGRGGMRGFG
ncbi:unnamed protein product, partial [Sphagnum compactum]